MKVIRFFIRPPAGAGMRTLPAAYVGMIGIGYLGVASLPLLRIAARALGLDFLIFFRLTTSYAVQARYAPLWLYGVSLLAFGIGLGVTRHRRRTWWARAIPGGLMALLAFMIGTWIQAAALTGALGFAVLIWACWMEIAFVEEY